MAESKYDESFPERAMGFASEGLTDSQIAYKMGVARSTFYVYKQRHPEFVEAIESGRDVVDGMVENRLLELALGNYIITTTVTDDEGRTRTTTKSAIPNLKAIQCWLERSDRRKGIKAQDKQDKPQVKAETEPAIQVVPVAAPEPGLDPSEIAGLQALAEYKSMYDSDADDGFSKKETAEFEDMMLVTFTEMERRKYNVKAEAEGRPAIPYAAGAPRTVKGKYAPDLIENWKARAELFEMDL